MSLCIVALVLLLVIYHILDKGRRPPVFVGFGGDVGPASCGFKSLLDLLGLGVEFGFGYLSSLGYGPFLAKLTILSCDLFLMELWVPS